MSTTTTIGQYIQQLKQLEYESDKLYYLASISGDRMMGLDVLLVMALLVVSDHDFFRICIVLLKNPDIYYLEKNLRSNLAWG